MKIVTDTDALKTSSEKIKGMVETYGQYYLELALLLNEINDWQGKDRANFEKTTHAALKRLEKLLDELDDASGCIDYAKVWYDGRSDSLIEIAKKI